MNCPTCGVPLDPVQVGGQDLQCCPSCEGVLVERQALLELREVSPSAHPLLKVLPAPDVDPSRDEEESRPCPRCGRAMRSYPYRGGRTVVESCGRCETLFLDHGELGRILDEWRRGLEMSTEAKDFLQGFREDSAWSRLLSVESALGTVGLTALTVFLYLAFEMDEHSFLFTHRYYTLPIPLAAAIAVAFYLFYRRRLKREKRAAKRDLKRIRREGSQRSATGRSPSLAGEAKPKRAGPPPAARCPWCNAPVPAGASHCKACDSDIF